jgi:hypothetical protein
MPQFQTLRPEDPTGRATRRKYIAPNHLNTPPANPSAILLLTDLQPINQIPVTQHAPLSRNWSIAGYHFSQNQQPISSHLNENQQPLTSNSPKTINF